MPDFSKGRIYKIVSPCGLTYYGSTTRRLWDRMTEHRSDTKIGKKCSSKRVIEAGGEIYLVEMYPCNSEEELQDRESWYIRYRPCVNEVIPDRTKEEYYQDNKEKILTYKKEYYQNNKRKQIEYCKSYYQNNKEEINERRNQSYDCECGNTYTHGNKARHFKTQKHMRWVENNQN